MLKQTFAAALVTCSSLAHASGLDISLSSETASIVYLTDSSSFGYGGADVGYGVFFNENDDFIINANFLVIGKPATSNNPLQLGVGAKAYFGEFDRSNLDLGALAIGGQIRYIIPSSLAPMAITAEGYYAPSVTSFGDAENVTEFTLRYEFEVVPSTRAYVGYRLLEADFETVSNVEFDDEVHVGIRFNF